MLDLQVNGYRGVDFSDAALNAAQALDACRQVLASGVDGFLPTVITSPLETYERVLPLWAKLLEREDLRLRLPGLHLEGPFISDQPGAVGAHPSEAVQQPSVRLLDRLYELAGGRIRLLTVAADAPGVVDVIRRAAELGIVVSLGHQLADAEQIAQAADAGASALTHLGNGLPTMIHRHHNPIWPALADDRLTMMVIADGHHLPWPMLRAMVRAKGVSRTVVVSDASPLAGLAPGNYQAFGLDDVVLQDDGLLWCPSRGCMVGSSLLLPACADRLAQQGVSAADIRQMTEDNPGRLLGEPQARARR